MVMLFKIPARKFPDKVFFVVNLFFLFDQILPYKTIVSADFKHDKSPFKLQSNNTQGFKFKNFYFVQNFAF